MNITRVVLLSLLAVWRPALAELTPTVRYLMTEPVSLLDWGIHRLDKNLEGATVEGEKLFVFVGYDRDANRINLSAQPRERRTRSLADAKTMCKETIGYLRWRLGVVRETGKALGGDHSGLRDFFSHEGYRMKDEPGNLAGELDAITELSALFFGVRPDNQRQKLVKCRGRLMSSEVLFEE